MRHWAAACAGGLLFLVASSALARGGGGHGAGGHGGGGHAGCGAHGHGGGGHAPPYLGPGAREQLRRSPKPVHRGWRFGPTT